MAAQQCAIDKQRPSTRGLVFEHCLAVARVSRVCVCCELLCCWLSILLFDCLSVCLSHCHLLISYGRFVLVFIIEHSGFIGMNSEACSMRLFVLMYVRNG